MGRHGPTVAYHRRRIGRSSAHGSGSRRRRALVGGGSGGLGGAIATALSGEGARVALVARPSDRLEAPWSAAGAVPVGADLSTPDGPAPAVAGAVAALGGLDLCS